MYYTIYRTTNVVNGKIYIGQHQTKNLDDRYLGSGKHLGHALKKHGVKNFQKEILFVFDNEDDMNAKEAELVTEEFCLRYDTYNICPGGIVSGDRFSRANALYYSDENAKIRRLLAAKKGNDAFREKLLDDEFRTNHVAKQTKSLGVARQVLAERYETDIEFKDNVLLRLAAMRKKSHSPEAKRKRKESMRKRDNWHIGSMWITDDLVNRKIKETDVIPHGWRKGRIIRTCGEIGSTR